MTTSPLPPCLRDHLQPLQELCRRHGVVRLDVFGSVVGGGFDAGRSDLDFIVEMRGEREPGYATRFCRFADELEMLFDRPVDLLTERMIRNPHFKAEVQRTRQSLLGLGHAG